VYDQHLSFVALEPGLFSLALPAAYQQLNDPAAKDTEVEVRALPSSCHQAKQR
jgi:hypothetical protein